MKSDENIIWKLLGDLFEFVLDIIFILVKTFTAVLSPIFKIFYSLSYKASQKFYSKKKLIHEDVNRRHFFIRNFWTILFLVIAISSAVKMFSK